MFYLCYIKCKFKYLLCNKLSIFSTKIYFNNFHQCEYNCNKVKQILNFYCLLLTSEIINQLAKKKTMSIFCF